MNTKNIFLWIFSLGLFSLIACNPVDTEDYEEWRLTNQSAYDAIKTNSAWTELETEDGPSGVYYRNLTEQGAEIGDEYPIETSRVVMNYTGRFYDDEVFDSATNVTFVVNEVVRGFGTALQYMRVGEKWDVCIPYQLAYGVTGSTDLYTGEYIIKPYTTLFFEIELLELTQYPK